jgi:hypothetical protein
MGSMAVRTAGDGRIPHPQPHVCHPTNGSRRFHLDTSYTKYRLLPCSLFRTHTVLTYVCLCRLPYVMAVNVREV